MTSLDETSQGYQGPEGADRVLVVDDEETIRVLLHDILAEEFALALASCGEEAIPFLEHQPPDVLVVDKNMPGMSGMDLLKRAKELAPDTEVIIITAYASLESAIEAPRLGAYDYMVKPFRHIVDVLEKVRRACEKKRLILERRLAQQAVRESEEMYRKLVETSPDSIMLVDPEGNIARANQQTAGLYGHENPEELVGKNYLDTIAQADRARALEDRGRILEAGDIKNAEYVFIRKNGSSFVGELSASRIEDSAGKPPGFIAVVRDITERKRMQAQLAQADRIASIGVLATGVAHEINNPLSYVLYNLESLAEGLPRLAGALEGKSSLGRAGTPNARDMLGDLVDLASKAVEGARRVRHIVRDLKTFSRVEEDRRVPVRLDRVLDGATGMVSNQIKFRARLVKEYGDTPTVLASEGRLSQVFVNLLVNAAQAIEEGDVEHNEIRVRTWTEGGEALAEVRDTGRGIPAEHLDRIFDPFFSSKPVDLGSGLGLSVCYNIVTSFGGRIEAESEPGRGSRFIVRLPLAPTEEAVSGPQAPPLEEPRLPGARGRILVVDDEPEICFMIERILRDEHDVVVAESGAGGKKVLEEDTGFDLILCDVMMPDFSGTDLYDWLAERSPELAGRMVFITGGAFTPRAVEFLDKVPNLQIEKPFRTKKLREIIRNLISGPA